MAEARRSAADVRALLHFRAAGLRGRSRRLAGYGFGVIVLLTVLAAWLPAYLHESGDRFEEVLLLAPTALLGILLIAVISAAASGGGRELIAREQAVAYPVSPTTDHLGALLMAPLNIAWLLQSWTLLGLTAYLAGPDPALPLAQLLMLAWLVTATALAQTVGWSVEWLRRGWGGRWLVRGLGAGLGLVGAYLVATDQLVSTLDASPTVNLTIATLQVTTGTWTLWVESMLVLAGSTAAAVLLGAWLAAAVARRPARDEHRLETSSYQPREHPISDLVALLRTDRVGIWRSVALRRGLVVLAVMPGMVAVAGNLEWDMLTILPGLVASGGALLFGVNSWCLDGRGALWRDSLPVSPRMVFASRAVVLVEVLMVATMLTLVLASLRAGLPSPAQLAAVLCGASVVVLQVVSASLRWSIRRPFAIDLRSARATPAPPLVMVGYSARLALTTTMTGLVFALTARASWEWSVVVALPFVLFSGYRLVRTSESWADPVTRCHVVSTVAS